MQLLNPERLAKDEVELYYYGFSSTQLYLNYRDCIDNRFKLLMLEVAKFYEQIKPNEVEETNESLFLQYKTFWAVAEQYLQKFYEDIQDILTLPDNVLPNEYKNPQNMLFNESVVQVENDIKNMEEEYMIGKFYLESLKHCMDLIQDKCLPLQNKVASANCFLKENMEKLQKFNILENKRNELLKTLEKKDKKCLAVYSPMATDFTKKKAILDDYRKLVNQNDKSVYV